MGSSETTGGGRTRSREASLSIGFDIAADIVADLDQGLTGHRPRRVGLAKTAPDARACDDEGLR
jgi:hypothetical protein